MRTLFAILQLIAACALAFALAFRITRYELRPDPTLDESGVAYADWVAEQVVEDWSVPFVLQCFPPRLRERVNVSNMQEAFAMHDHLGKLLGPVDPRGSVSRSRTGSGKPIDLGTYECHIEFENGFLVMDLETARLEETWWLIGLGLSAPRVMDFDEFDTDKVLRTEAGQRARRRSDDAARNAENVSGKVAKDLELLYGETSEDAK